MRGINQNSNKRGEDMAEKHGCVQCGTGSDERLLIQCELKGKLEWVCARCLPMFIHGGGH